VADKPAGPEGTPPAPGDDKPADTKDTPAAGRPEDRSQLSRQELEQLRRDLLRRFH